MSWASAHFPISAKPGFDTATCKSLLQLADTLDADEIARRTGHDEGDIQALIDAAGVPGKSKWWVRCNRTGRLFTAASKSGAYRLVCLKGLTDWDWGRGEGGALMLPPPASHLAIRALG